jgi:hypothetical protein
MRDNGAAITAARKAQTARLRAATAKLQALGDQESHQYRYSECRYCTRYRRACGRIHSAETRGDWGRDWAGNEPTPLSDLESAMLNRPQFEHLVREGQRAQFFGDDGDVLAEEQL